MYFHLDVDLTEINFECGNCMGLLKIKERLGMVKTVLISPCSCILKDEVE